MSYTIALAGKGGTGKTTIAALLARLLKENKSGAVLAVDADPNSNFCEALGIASGPTIGEIVEDIAAHPEKIPAGMGKDSFLEFQIQSALAESEGIDCLSMGRPEGPGCYCYVNNVLRNMMAKLGGEYDYVIIDNEAGLEHLSRRTTRKIDFLVVVSDQTAAGLRAAKRINQLAGELKIEIKRSGLVVNRYQPACAGQKLENMGLDYLGSLPYDPQLEEISYNGGSLMGLKDSAPFLGALRKLGEKIWQRN